MRPVRRKTCRDCRRVLSLRNFYAHPTTSDGHMNVCKTCHKRNVSENRALKPEIYNAIHRRHDARRKEARRRYLSLPHVRERTLRYQRENYQLDKALEATA